MRAVRTAVKIALLPLVPLIYAILLTANALFDIFDED
jgi:hypothetical protein